MERRIRLANSTPDVKTLLQNSSYVYSKEGEELDETGLASRFSGMGLQRPGSGEYLPPPSTLVSIMPPNGTLEVTNSSSRVEPG